MDSTNSLYSRFESIPTILTAKITPIRIGSYEVGSIWKHSDVTRLEKTSFIQSHVISSVDGGNDLSFKRVYSSAPTWSSYGSGFPNTKENGAQCVWDSNDSSGRRRALCLEYELPSSKMPVSAASKASCPLTGTFVQIWSDGLYGKTIQLPNDPVSKPTHGKVYSDISGTFIGAAWSHDASRIVYISEAVELDGLKNPEAPFLYKDNWGEGLAGTRQTVVCVLDIAAETVISVIDQSVLPDVAPTKPIWCPGDTGLVFIGYSVEAYRLGLKYCLQRPCQLYHFDYATKCIRRISDSHMAVDTPRFSPDGKQLIWLENHVGGPHQQCRALMGLAWPWDGKVTPRVIVPVPDKMPTRDAFPGIYGTLTNECWTMDSRCVILSSIWGMELALLIVDTHVAPKDAISRVLRIRSPIEQLPSSVNVLTVSHNVLVASVSSPIHPDAIGVLQIPDDLVQQADWSIWSAKCKWLTIPAGTAFGEVPIPRVTGMDCSIMRFPETTGNCTESLLIQPVKDNANGLQQVDVLDILSTQSLIRPALAPPPMLHGLIVWPHGGPHSAFTATWLPLVTSFVASGFACLLINYRGSLGYGADAIRSLLGKIGEQDVDDCIQATDLALSELDRLYGHRPPTFLFGGSHGGFLVLHLAARYPTRFQAAVARNPVTNLVSMLDTSDIPDWDYTEAGLQGSDGPAWSLASIPSDSELATMAKMSPLFRLNTDWVTPLSLMIGAQDLRVPSSQGLTFYRRLKAMNPNVPCQLNLYPHDTHPLESPAASRDVFQKTIKCWLMDFDRTLEQFIEGGEEGDDYDSTTSASRSGTIFLVDCTRSMLGLSDVENSDSCGMTLALSCCQTVLQNKAICAPLDLVGLVFMRTRESSSSEKSNIYIIQPLAPPDAPRIMELESLRKLTPKEMDQRFGTIPITAAASFGLHEALWACQNMFTNCSKSLGYRQIMLLTDDPDPLHGKPHAKRQALIKVTDLKQSGIDLEVLPIRRHDGVPFDFDLFYQDLITDEDEDFFGIQTAKSHVDPMYRMEQLLTRVRARELPQRRLTRLAFHLGPDSSLALGVSAYCLVRRQPAPAPVWLHATDSRPVTVRQQRFKTTPTTQRSVDEEGESGDTLDNLLLPHDLVRGVKFGKRQLCFDRDELEGDMRAVAPVGLHLLGFKPLKRLRRFHHIRAPQFIYPDESQITGSRLWFTTLLQVCLDRKLFAMALYVQRRNASPRLIALTPQAEELDEDGTQNQPPGFHVIFLPFADDFRELDIPVHDMASEEQVEVAKAMVRKLTVPFDSKQVSNPILQRHYAMLEALALNKEHVEEMTDPTLPNVGAINRRAKTELDKFKQVCHLEGASASKKPRCTSSAQQKPTNDPLTEDRLRVMHRRHELSKLTIPVLREALKILNLVAASGNRKADLVDQLTQYFNR